MSGIGSDSGARDGHTIVRPKPGRAGSPRPAAPPRNATMTRVDLLGGGHESIVHAALPLLVLAGRLRHGREPADTRVLHDRLVEAVRDFDERVRAAGVPDEDVGAARYMLCATLDSAVVGTSWGSRVGWLPLLFLFHRASGGLERVLSHIAGVADDPLGSSGVQEIAYFCLSLGLESPGAPADAGLPDRNAIRRRLLESLRNRRGESLGTLAPHWHPAITRRRVAVLRRRVVVPEFLMLGSPSSGKSTALTEWGLIPDGVRWAAGHASVLELQVDDGWPRLLEGLRGRRRSAIEGVVLACSLETLLLQPADRYNEELRRLRTRLRQLDDCLGARLPVYVLVTRVDRLRGFREHFGDLDSAGREQVLGITFHIDDSRSGRAARTFPAEFDSIARRLNGRIAQRLWDEPSARRRALAFEFPRQFAAMRARAVDLVAQISGGEDSRSGPLLRGLYFTAVPRCGHFIDALTGVASAVAWTDPERGPAGADVDPPYFIESLLSKLVVPDAGIARSRVREMLGALARRITSFLPRPA